MQQNLQKKCYSRAKSEKKLEEEIHPAVENDPWGIAHAKCR